jgi:hypothetical protein
VFRNLHSDPCWQPLLVRIGLSDEQVKVLDFKIAVPSQAGVP